MKGIVNRINGTIVADSAVPKKHTVIPPAPFELGKIEISNLCFGFQGKKQLLKNVTFDVSKGEMVVLLGDRNTGKSSLLKIIQKEYIADSGDIRVNGNNLNEIQLSTWGHVFASVSPCEKIFNNTLIYNLTMSNSLQNIHHVVRFCKRYNFDKFFDILPQGYLTRLGSNFNITESQRKIIGLARALYRKPQLLLVDDITADTSAETEDFILDTLENLRSEMAIIFATQRATTALYADRVYMFSKC